MMLKFDCAVCADRYADSNLTLSLLRSFIRSIVLWAVILYSNTLLAGESDNSQLNKGQCYDNPPAESLKRGASYHFCGWDMNKGVADFDVMAPRLAWYYNWSSRPMVCPDDDGIGNHEALSNGDVEFVPMVWGLVNGGEDCESGGACFRVDARDGGASCKQVCQLSDDRTNPSGACWQCYHQAISRASFLQDVPSGARYLLGYNEPNFKEQAGLTPDEAARGWRHVQWVADRGKLALVGPATNFCDPTPGAHHPGACIEAVDGTPMLGLSWLERFYDACTETGAAGFDCRIDHQAVHAYSRGNVLWMIRLMKIKAGMVPPTEKHCTNGKLDENEFGIDCGGVACVACSETARKHFAKPVWLTEFAMPASDSGGPDRSKTVSRKQLVKETVSFMRDTVGGLENDPYVYRYAWFMPKTNGASLDHVDLMVEDKAGVMSELGRIYFGHEACTP